MSSNVKAVQDSFVNAIKNPSSFEAENSDVKRRMAIYQTLFFNNINGFVSTGFPVLKSLIQDADWQVLVRTFFIQHSCRSPYFVEISKAFVEYLSVAPTLSIELPEFAAELAHYEWLELDVSIRKHAAPVNYYNANDTVTHVAVSPFATLVSYAYAVHLIGPDYQPQAPEQEQQYYVVYRDKHQSVQFAHINAITAMLLNLLEQQRSGMSLTELGTQLTQQLPHIDEPTVLQGMQFTLTDMLEKGIVVPG